jgi:exonuclease III
MVKLHDITVLAETRTSDASRLLQHLPGFTVHNIQLDRGNEGKNRHGIAVLVASSCSDYVLVLKTSENVQCIWMQCDKKMFALEEDVNVGAAYINPQSRKLFPVCAIQTHFTDLFEDTLGALQVSPNVVLCGDFNAHVGELSEVSDAHTGIVLRFLRLGDMCATV